MSIEAYQCLVFGLMVLLCISTYYRGFWHARATEEPGADGGWADEAKWWRARQIRQDEDYALVARQDDE